VNLLASRGETHVVCAGTGFRSGIVRVRLNQAIDWACRRGGGE
jgi:hypothetical protein